jgi:hypothetical protein
LPPFLLSRQFLPKLPQSIVGARSTCKHFRLNSSSSVSLSHPLSSYPLYLPLAQLPDILVFSSVPQSDEIVPNPKLLSAPATLASHCLAVRPPRALRSRHHARLDVRDLLVRAQLLISSVSDTPIHANDHIAMVSNSSRSSSSR